MPTTPRRLAATKRKTPSGQAAAPGPRTTREQYDDHLASAARLRATQLLKLARKLVAGKANDDERAAIQWQVLGAHLETPVESAGLANLALYLTEWSRSVHSVDVAHMVQHRCALLGLERPLKECAVAIEKARKVGPGAIAWAAAARLYLGAKASSAIVRAAEGQAQKWNARALGKISDARENRSRKRTR
ncbi:MAG TPA: hypothetical protein VHP33_33605 [Polyangiaceae bacterium]|nr:hypothetical protein [Polyangiaceae bacterium]